MAIQVNTASGSMTLTAEDGVGNANVEIPRAGFPTQIVSASDGEAITGTDTAKFVSSANLTAVLGDASAFTKSARRIKTATRLSLSRL
jgi:hypothetical protein